MIISSVMPQIAEHYIHETLRMFQLVTRDKRVKLFYWIDYFDKYLLVYIYCKAKQYTRHRYSFNNAHRINYLHDLHLYELNGFLSLSLSPIVLEKENYKDNIYNDDQSLHPSFSYANLIMTNHPHNPSRLTTD